jgi:tagaturonate epimerase
LIDVTTITDRFTTLGLQPSFGFGDRIGLATPGHIGAMKLAGSGVGPIFAQQSIREMTRTHRSPSDVISAAVDGMRAAEWNEASGADADHLKTAADVDATAVAGFVFFTIDPSQFVDTNADDYDLNTLRDKFRAIRDQVAWVEQYTDARIPLPDGKIAIIDAEDSMRCAVKYGLAIERAIDLAKYIRQVTDAIGRPAEIELSIDETPQPTTLAEHFIIADQCRRRGVKLVSLAPRFIGEFEKGVDYKGNLAELESSLADHAFLARELGPYKLSLHSGSDKLSLYPILARATRGCFHVKTAGTSYLEALRVAAHYDESLFRAIIDKARQHYDTDKATYHVSATIDTLPTTADCSSTLELERVYLERWQDVSDGRGFINPGRQVLHCTFGTVLADEQLGGRLRQLLESHADSYCEILTEHFRRHLVALTSAM